jgi:hypothetical protein
MQANIACREADGEHGMKGIILRAHLPPALRQLATSAEMKAFEVCACLCTPSSCPILLLRDSLHLNRVCACTGGCIGSRGRRRLAAQPASAGQCVPEVAQPQHEVCGLLRCSSDVGPRRRCVAPIACLTALVWGCLKGLWQTPPLSSPHPSQAPPLTSRRPPLTTPPAPPHILDTGNSVAKTMVMTDAGEMVMACELGGELRRAAPPWPSRWGANPALHTPTHCSIASHPCRSQHQQQAAASSRPWLPRGCTFLLTTVTD